MPERIAFLLLPRGCKIGKPSTLYNSPLTVCAYASHFFAFSFTEGAWICRARRLFGLNHLGVLRAVIFLILLIQLRGPMSFQACLGFVLLGLCFSVAFLSRARAPDKVQPTILL